MQKILRVCNNSAELTRFNDACKWEAPEPDEEAFVTRCVLVSCLYSDDDSEKLERLPAAILTYLTLRSFAFKDTTSSFFVDHPKHITTLIGFAAGAMTYCPMCQAFSWKTVLHTCTEPSRSKNGQCPLGLGCVIANWK